MAAHDICAESFSVEKGDQPLLKLGWQPDPALARLRDAVNDAGHRQPIHEVEVGSGSWVVDRVVVGSGTGVCVVVIGAGAVVLSVCGR